GVRQDLAEAGAWYRKAAEQGHEPAQYRLARAYERGQGVEQDPVKAYAWMYAAARNNETRALKALNAMRENLSRAELLEAEKLGKRYCNEYTEPAPAPGDAETV